VDFRLRPRSWSAAGEARLAAGVRCRRRPFDLGYTYKLLLEADHDVFYLNAALYTKIELKMHPCFSEKLGYILEQGDVSI
jgi:hypothetical protein